VDFRLSPDERRLAVSRVDPIRNRSDLAILNLATGGQTRLSASPQTDASPVWSPDGTRLVFRSNRHGQHDLFERAADGGEDKLLYSNKLGLYPTDWSASDGLLVFHFLSDENKHDIWALDPRHPASSARALVANAATEAQGQLGPGRRLAYTSDESGRLNVYVRRLDPGTTPLAVSVNGGFDPRWSADGRALFFISDSGKVMKAELTGADGMQLGAVRELFQSTVQGPTNPYLSNYVVTRDGRFLFNVPAQQPGEEPITLTMDWLSRFKSDTP
jgi:eukaryotic-like serine/threonine-protein kinase